MNQGDLTWLQAACLTTAEAGNAILISVVASQGSVPRAAGAKMLVTANAQFDTIGGGHLEYRAIASARSMLAQVGTAHISQTPQMQRLALGPSLGQCCGGVVHLLFEPVGPAQQAHFAQLLQRWQQRQTCWRWVGLDSYETTLLENLDNLQFPDYQTDLACQILATPNSSNGARHMLDTLRPGSAHLMLFGAGHVARQVVWALAHLPCHIDWVDVRADYFPASVPANVTLHYCDDPETLVEQASNQVSFLVMTHHHALDQSIVEAVLRRSAFTWLGLIGSATKRAQFERRLSQRGIAADKLAQMVCPIGIAGMNSKLPAVIAASVCAQLLQVWHAAGQLPPT
jgi:xanthine dehydrogenase accessory factor